MSGLFKKSIPPLLIVALCAIAIGACFSPWKGDTGTLLINIGGGGSGRALLDIEKEPATLEHEVILRGPGGTITRKFPGPGAVAASFELAAGTWDLAVRAVGDTPEDYNFEPDTPSPENDGTFPPRTLRAYGWNTVEIRAGQSSSARVDMVSATEVSNYGQLARGLAVLTRADTVREVFLVSGDIEVNYNNGAGGFIIETDWDITFVADETVSIAGVDISNPLFTVYRGVLTLGRPRMRGRLTIDDGNPVFPHPVVNNSYGELIMNDGVTLRNGGGGAVQVAGSTELGPETIFGTFTMNGGTISGNHTTDGNGGGVYVANYGIFTMNGGTICGNTADAGMNDGDGGGVYVEYGGSFSKTGGTIYGNEPGINPVLANTASSGKGQAVFVQGDTSSTLANGSYPNKGRDATAGPGVNLDSDSMLNWDFQ